MDENFLHSLTADDDSEKPDADMDWQHMKSLLDKEMPVAPPFAVPPPNTYFWLKSLVVAALVGTTCLFIFLRHTHNKKELNDSKIAELHLPKMSAKHNGDTNNASGASATIDSFSSHRIASDSAIYTANNKGPNAKISVGNTDSAAKTKASLSNTGNKRNKEIVLNTNKNEILNKIGTNNKTTADSLNRNDVSVGGAINNKKKYNRNRDRNSSDSSTNMPANGYGKNNPSTVINHNINKHQIDTGTSFKRADKTLTKNQEQLLKDVAFAQQNNKKINAKLYKNKITESNNIASDDNKINFIGVNDDGNIRIDKSRPTENGQSDKATTFDKPNNNLHPVIDLSKGALPKKLQDNKEAPANGGAENVINQTTNATNDAGQNIKQKDLENTLPSNKADSNNGIKKQNRGIVNDTTASSTKLSRSKIKTNKQSKGSGNIDWGFYIGTQQHFATGGQSNDSYGLNGSSNPLQNYIPSFALEIAKNKWSLGLQAAILQPAYLKHQTIKSLDSTATGPTLVKLFQSPVSLQIGYKILSNMKIFTGAGIAFNQRAILISPPDTSGSSMVSAIKGKDFSAYGLTQANPFWTVGFEYKFKRFVVGMQYSQGFGPLVNYNNISQKPQDLQLFLRYELFKKKKK